MICWLDIMSPTESFLRIKWPDSVPYPSVGDRVLFRQHDIAWSFEVLSRVIGVGYDPITKQPGANVSLKVDVSAPPGWAPEHHC